MKTKSNFKLLSEEHNIYFNSKLIVKVSLYLNIMRMTPPNFLTLRCLFPVKQLVGRDFKTLLPFGAKSYTVILGAVMN